MKMRRTLAFLLAAALSLTLCPVALAADATSVSITVGTPTLTSKYVMIPVTLTNETVTTANPAGETLALKSVIPSGKALASTALACTGEKTLLPAGVNDLLLEAEIPAGATGTVVESLEFKFEDSAGTPISKFINVMINFGEDSTATPAPDADKKDPIPFRVSSIDPNGKVVPTASGDSGDRITLRVPLLCITQERISNVSITPKLSTSLDEFPFDITQVDYTLNYAGPLGPSQVIEFDYPLRIAKKATAGVKKVDFTVYYYKGWTSNPNEEEKVSMDVSIYLNILKGYTEEGPGTDTPVSAPKLILEGYSLSADKIYAGETFDVTFTLRNTSTEEDVQNIQIKVEDTAEIGKVIPADNGSNTLYVGKIKKGESETVKMSLQTAADTEAKAYKLNLGFSYEGAKSLTTYTPNESITVTIMQKIRLKFDDPVLDGEPMQGQPCPVYFAMYNMGKASIYNCIVSVEGEGLEMEETYFGGTVAAGSTMRADFNIITNTPGDIPGEIVITYEDSLGEQMEERLPLSLYVMEEMGMGDEMGMPGMGDPMPGIDDPMMEPGMGAGAGVSGFPWVWVAVGVAVTAGIVVLIVVLKKRRAKSLEDV